MNNCCARHPAMPRTIGKTTCPPLSSPSPAVKHFHKGDEKPFGAMVAEFGLRKRICRILNLELKAWHTQKHKIKYWMCFKPACKTNGRVNLVGASTLKNRNVNLWVCGIACGNRRRKKTLGHVQPACNICGRVSPVGVSTFKNGRSDTHDGRSDTQNRHSDT